MPPARCLWAIDFSSNWTYHKTLWQSICYSRFGCVTGTNIEHYGHYVIMLCTVYFEIHSLSDPSNCTICNLQLIMTRQRPKAIWTVQLFYMEQNDFLSILTDWVENMLVGFQKFFDSMYKTRLDYVSVRFICVTCLYIFIYIYKSILVTSPYTSGHKGFTSQQMIIVIIRSTELLGW